MEIDEIPEQLKKDFHKRMCTVCKDSNSKPDDFKNCPYFEDCFEQEFLNDEMSNYHGKIVPKDIALLFEESQLRSAQDYGGYFVSERTEFKIGGNIYVILAFAWIVGSDSPSNVNLTMLGYKGELEE